MMNKFGLILIFGLLFSLGITKLTAQNYSTAAGVRGGGLNAISVKHFVDDGRALEGIVATRWRGMQITGLYQIHAQAFNVENLYWYYGGGAHIGFFNGYKDHPYFDDDKSYTNIGIDGVIGLEYVFQEIPINISVDWKPEFNIIGASGVWFGDGGIAIRYYW
ncbi:MAG: hypothetical protein KDB74_07785 [Flavobacteriales bacterium]|nr:hypothetical protein [Flavobacteriales bacterium]